MKILYVGLLIALTSIVHGKVIKTCENDSDQMSIETKVIITKDLIVQERTFFDKPNCDPKYAFLKESREGTYVLDHEYYLITITGVFQTPYARFAASLNEDVECGFQDWKDGESKLVAGLDCSHTERNIGDVIQVEKKVIYDY